MKILKTNRGRVRGFTLIEVMVSVAIIAMISGIFLANYHRYKSSGSLAMAAQILASNIRQMQNYALGLKSFNGSVPNGGWGIFISTSQFNGYYLFADNNGDNACNANCAAASTETSSQFKNTLPPQISITSIKIGNSTITNPLLNFYYFNVVFRPPNPDITICSTILLPFLTDCTYKTFEIVLFDTTSGATKTVLINKYGLIDVN